MRERERERERERKRERESERERENSYCDSINYDSSFADTVLTQWHINRELSSSFSVLNPRTPHESTDPSLKEIKGKENNSKVMQMYAIFYYTTTSIKTSRLRERETGSEKEREG